jgi:hypothetical protein
MKSKTIKNKTARQLLGRSKNKRLGWHLIGEDSVTYRGLLKVRVGQKLEMKTSGRVKHNLPSVCIQGMHASHVIHKTMKRAGTVLCRVLVEGDITDYELLDEVDFDRNGKTVYTAVRCGKYRDKFAGRYRTVLWKKELPTELQALEWDLDGYTGKGVAKKLRDWARENGAPYVDCDSYGKKLKK